MALARRPCRRKAVAAVARKPAMIMHAMWVDGTFTAAIRQSARRILPRCAAVNDRKRLGAYA
jgi:transposase